MEQWRLLDTGALNAFENIALDETLLEARSKENKIDICRRITGGGAIFFDEPQIGWELIVDKTHPKVPKKIEEVYRVMCESAVAGLKKLGVQAEFRPKNDIEVQGRKISGTGGAEDRGMLFFQGTLLTDFDVETMLKALRVPIEKLQYKEMDSMRERVTCLREQMEEMPPIPEIKKALIQGIEEYFEVELVEGGLTPDEERLFGEKVEHFQSDEWVYDLRRPLQARQAIDARHKTKGGLIRVSLIIDKLTEQIQSSLITGDFTVFPKRTIFDLESSLKGCYTHDVEKEVLAFFDAYQPRIPMVEPRDFVHVIEKAVAKLKYRQFGLSFQEANDIYTVVRPFEEITDVTHLLLPYCSKLVTCEHRHTKECTVCGECTISDALKMAEEFDLQPITIISYEDLEATLEDMKNDGAPAFIGCCCEAFYVKHLEDFEKIGLPGVLVNIDDETCYDLGKQQDAYVGKFESQTHLKLELLRKMLEEIKRAKAEQ